MGGELFAISKFLRAKHSSVQRLIAFLLEGVEKSISLVLKKKELTLKALCVFFCALKYAMAWDSNRQKCYKYAFLSKQERESARGKLTDN